jgi:hypothetical protein
VSYCLGDFPQRVLDLGNQAAPRGAGHAPARSPARKFTRSKRYKVSQVIRERVEDISG